MYQYSSQYSSKTNVDSHNQVMSNMNYSFNKFYYSSSSWEEQAGFVWPPRCYCCNFCKREFRSAQALGGHMNVHRRDRAKLKHDQSLCPQNQAVHDEALSKSMTTLSKSQKLSPARVNSCSNSKTVALTNYSDEPTNFSRLASPVIKKRVCSSPDLKRTSDEKGARKEVILLDDENYVEANLSVGISMAASEYPKRQKSSMFLLSPILHKPYRWSDKYCSSTSDKLGIRTSSMENIDLELRLGPSITS